MKTKLLFGLILIQSICYAQDQVLLVSGGDDPGLNHYAQYLQTKTLYNQLLTRYDASSVALYFGAGNNFSIKPALLDVHKITNSISHKNDKTDSVFYGTLQNNHAATKKNVTEYFFSPAAQNLNDTQNLLIFVSDHGMPHAFLEDKSANAYSNNCIDLWHYQNKFVNNFIDANNFYDASLCKNELSALLSPIKAKHIVFEMSQCFSGGFHQLTVTQKNGYPSANPQVCGFTATPPDHYASGCTADADGATYQGYERSFTQWYTGNDVVTGKKLREPAKDIFSAHQNAALEDMTVDVPLSSSDYYLLQWATLFSDNKFTSRMVNYHANQINEIYKNFQQYRPEIDDKNFQNFNQFAKANENKILSLLPTEKTFSQLSLAEQSSRIELLDKNIQEDGQHLDIAWDGIMNVYLNLVMPAWSSALAKHEVKFLTPKQYLYEKEFYQKIITEHLYKRPYQFDMYFGQYLSMKKNDPQLFQYKKARYNFILRWATENKNKTLENAVKHLQALDKAQQELQDRIALAEKNKQLLNRIYIYNKIIAAWVTLHKIQDKQALDELNGLLACEHSA